MMAGDRLDAIGSTLGGTRNDVPGYVRDVRKTVSCDLRALLPLLLGLFLHR